MVGGNLGMALCVLSQSGNIKMTFTTDESIIDNESSKMFLKSIEDIIVNEMNKETD